MTEMSNPYESAISLPVERLARVRIRLDAFGISSLVFACLSWCCFLPLLTASVPSGLLIAIVVLSVVGGLLGMMAGTRRWLLITVGLSAWIALAVIYATGHLRHAGRLGWKLSVTNCVQVNQT